MADRPFLIFPSPRKGKRKKKQTGYAQLPLPARGKQKKRVGAQFKELESLIKAKAVALRDAVSGEVPEQVIVLETVGTVSDFIKAVQKVPGLEWLVEFEDESEADEELFDEELQEPISGRLFLVLANQAAMKQLLDLWRSYKKDAKASFPHGLGRFREVFRQLKNVRTWNASDRLLSVGLNEFLAGQLDPDAAVRVEAEMWYRADEAARRRASARIASLIQSAGGQLLSEAVVSEIRYHGILAALPARTVRQMVESQDTQLVLCDDVMFFRPASQFLVWTAPEAEVDIVEEGTEGEGGAGPPIVAVLDGLPVANHVVLRGHLTIDDPDDWASRYPVEQRFHGTAMASLVLRGDMHSDGEALRAPLYVRPILLPAGSFGDVFVERMPPDQLPVDLVHRAVRRIFEGEGKESPAAPSVRVINFSIGDPARHFGSETSPLARLLDWLSWKYDVLFVVSAGNHPDVIELDVPAGQLEGLSNTERQNSILRAISRESAQRRLLSPAEAVNVLTVGASHGDAGDVMESAVVWNPYESDRLPSPITALGRGHNRSIKPDILAPGGRLHFRERPRSGPNTTIKGVAGSRAPGQRAAMPARGGELRATGNFVGTSNAAAIATRGAVFVHSTLERLRKEAPTAMLDSKCTAVLIKAALVHSASWGDGRQLLYNALEAEYGRGRLRDMAIRSFGYGHIDFARAIAAADERATLVGAGFIGADESHSFEVPLPPGIAGQKVWRRLTITLAWSTPINCGSRAYRKAALFFDPVGEELQVERKDSDWLSARRGTIQHEVLEGQKATAFSDGQMMSLIVSCKSDKARLKENVPYALFASLEVAAGIGIPIYDQIKARLRGQVPVAPVAARG